MVNYNTNEQVYNVREDDALASRVALVICVLLQRGLFIAGFSITEELLTIQYSGYNKNKPVWELDFFEHIFANESILAAKDKVKGVFLSSDKNLVVPEELYLEHAAKDWLRKIHFVEANDVISAYPLVDENAMYITTAPVNITELIKINFKQAVMLPMAMYQFRNPDKYPFHMQLCISNEQVCASLHNNSLLLWHRVFKYSSAEDIAYTLQLYCQESKIALAELNVSCNALSAAEFERVNELSQYFPAIKAGNGRTMTTAWDGAISLAQQLFSCV